MLYLGDKIFSPKQSLIRRVDSINNGKFNEESKK